MSKRSLLFLLVFWNILLTGAMVWALTRPKGLKKADRQAVSLLMDSTLTAVPRDTVGLAKGRIAFFFMDSVRSKYELVEESAKRVRAEGKVMEDQLQREMQTAQARYNELMSKDHTYSTQAELQKDQTEIEQLGTKIQEQRSNSQDRLDEMQSRMLQDITTQIQAFLEDYNATARYDYIFSIQDAGQIWVGNKGLDITNDVVSGLNKRHHDRKASGPK